MAERANPHANLIIGAQDEATPVFEKIKASSQSMAAGVEQAATKAAGAVGGIGDKAAPAAQKLDGITSSMIRQVQRLNAELEAGGARNAAYFEKMASVKGADLSALAPYLADLKKAEAAQRVATTGLDRMGMSAKQTTAALRQVPMQFTDIVVSLQGGQSAMQVFLQQGGQLKDLFGGIGPAARAMGGYVAGLVNPFTMAAAAIATIAVAYKQGSAEADGYRMALVMTGNAAGTTAAQMQQMAGRISSVVGTQGAAAEALAQMASSGRVASQSLEYFSEVAIKFERTTGTAISETVKRFAELGASPVDASRKLNEETNYLTASIYEQIKALKAQGREADAATLAQNAYADALNDRSAQITQNLGAIEGAWRDIKDAAKSGWDAMLNVGRADSLGTQIDNVRAKIAQAKGQDKNRPFSMPWDTPLADLEQQLSYLTEQERVIRRGAEAQAQRTRAEKEAIAAADALQKTQASGLTNQQKMNKALEEYSRHIEKLKATNPASALLSPDAIARGEKAIRDQFSDKGKGSAGIKSANKDLADQARLIAELSGLTGSFAKDWDVLSAAYARGGMSMEQLVELQAALLAKQPAIKASADEQNKAQQSLAKANLDAAASREKYLTSLSTGLDKIQADITAQIEATERMGLSKEAIAELDAAKLEMLATDLELQAIKAMDRNLDQQTYDALKKQAAAYRELGNAKRAGAARETAVEEAKEAQAEWQKTADSINNTLTDALMRGFESGKGFAKNLRDTVVNMFKTMVLRPTISAVLAPVGAALAGGAQAGQGGAAQGGSSALGMLGNVGALAGAFGTGMAASFTSMMSAGIGGWATAAGSLIGSGATAGIAAGLGMIAAPVALAAALWKPLFGRKLKDSGIEGTFGGESGFEGNSFEFLKGGLFRSNKTNRSPLDEATRSGLGDAFLAIRSQVGSFADALGLQTDKLAGYTSTIKLSLKGLSAEDAQKKIGEALQTQSNELAKQVLGVWETTVSTVVEKMQTGFWDNFEYTDVERQVTSTTYAPSVFAREGEEAIDTLTRLATSLTTVNGIFDTLGTTLYEASLAGADMASSLIDAFGGMDQFAAATSSYYEAFYSEQERTETALRQLSETLGKLGLALPDAAASDALGQYRKLVEAQDLNTEAGRNAYAALVTLGGGFAQLVGSTQSLAQAAADAARAIKQERGGLMTSLYQALGNTGALRAEQLAGLDPANRALQEQIFAVEDAKAALQKAMAAEAASAQAAQEAAQERVSALQSIFDALKSNIDSLYESVEPVKQMAADQANAFLSNALANARATGYLPEPDALADAIAGARGGLDKQYATSVDAERDRLLLAGKLSELKDVAEPQLTAAQRQLRAAERQVSALSALVNQGQQMLDSLSGNTTATLSIVDAIAGLSAAVMGAMGAMSARNYVAPTASNYVASLPAGAVYDAMAATPTDDREKSIAGLYKDLLGREADIGGLTQWAKSTLGMAEIAASISASVEAQVRAQSVDKQNEFIRLVNQELGLKSNIKAFAAGGYHTGGLRIVGENGPELEATGPSRIWNAQQLSGAMGSGNTERLEKLVEGLTAEVQRLQSVVATGNRHAERTATVLDDAARGKQPLSTAV